MPYNDIEAIKDILANGSGSGGGGSSYVHILTDTKNEYGVHTLDSTFNEVKEMMESGAVIAVLPWGDPSGDLYGIEQTSTISLDANSGIQRYSVTVYLPNNNHMEYTGSDPDGDLTFEEGD